MSEYQNPTGRITAAHQNLRDALSTYLDLITPAVLSGLGPQGALDATREFETLRNQMAIADHAHITALQDTHAAAVCARPSTATLLALTLRITPAQARARVRAAHALTPRVALTGAALPALRPVLAKKQATGTVTPAQAGRVLHHLHEFDANPRISTEQVEQAEHMLTELTDTLGPNELDTAADRIADVLDPDGDPPSDEETQRRRALTISPNGQITGQLTARRRRETARPARPARRPARPTRPGPTPARPPSGGTTRSRRSATGSWTPATSPAKPAPAPPSSSP